MLLDLDCILDAIEKAETEVPERYRLVRITYDGEQYLDHRTNRPIRVQRISSGLSDFQSGWYKDPQQARIRVIRSMLINGRMSQADAYEVLEFGAEEVPGKRKEYVGSAKVLYYKKISLWVEEDD